MEAELLPGYGIIQEANTAQDVLPGYGSINETVSGVTPPTVAGTGKGTLLLLGVG